MASKLKKAAEASPKDPPPLTEEEAMEAAIRMSLAVKHDVSPASGDGDGNGDGEAARSSKAMEMDEEEEMSEEAIWAAIRQKEEEERLAATKKDPQTLKAEAEARLPAEPEPSNVGVVRVAMRLSDGSRVQRRFETKVKVQSLFDFLIASSLEAAEKGGSAFDLALAEPGAKPLVNPHDGGAGAEMTLEDAGLSGSVLLVVKWRG